MSIAQPHRRDFLHLSAGAALGAGVLGTAAGAFSYSGAEALSEREQLVHLMRQTMQAAQRVLDGHGVGCEREACCDVCWRAGRILKDLGEHERAVTGEPGGISPSG